MNDPVERGGLSLANFATLLAIILSLGSLVYGAGIQAAQIADNKRRIEVLEAKNDRMFEAIARIDTRTATIETKLSILIPSNNGELAR